MDRGRSDHRICQSVPSGTTRCLKENPTQAVFKLTAETFPLVVIMKSRENRFPEYVPSHPEKRPCKFLGGHRRSVVPAELLVRGWFRVRSKTPLDVRSAAFLIGYFH